MGRKSALNELEKGKILAFKVQGLFVRVFDKQLKRSPGVMGNFV